MPRIFSGKQDIYIEVAERYRKYITLGVIADGEKLPSVRTCAEELGVNPNTVQKAYALLEEEGLIYSLPKKGVFVSCKAGGTASKKSTDSAREAIEKLRFEGFTKSEIEKIVKEVYEE